MILVFILAFIALLIVVLMLSVIKIDVRELKVDSGKKSEWLEELHIYLQLYFLGKIKIGQISINKNKLKKIPIDKLKEKMKQIDIKELEMSKFEKQEIKKAVKELQINVEKINLEMNVGVDDMMLTTVIVTLISVGIGILLPHVVKKYVPENYYYKIMPIYTNQNKIKIDFKCIICTKVVHIIYVIYILIKMRRVKNNERTSNRRYYDYSYE